MTDEVRFNAAEALDAWKRVAKWIEPFAKLAPELEKVVSIEQLLNETKSKVDENMAYVENATRTLDELNVAIAKLRAESEHYDKEWAWQKKEATSAAEKIAKGILDDANGTAEIIVETAKEERAKIKNEIEKCKTELDDIVAKLGRVRADLKADQEEYNRFLTRVRG